jgi:hypothetical protein
MRETTISRQSSSNSKRRRESTGVSDSSSMIGDSAGMEAIFGHGELD